MSSDPAPVEGTSYDQARSVVSNAQEDRSGAACAAAVQNFMLFLWKAGVGSKWTTGDITRAPRFFEIVGVDARTEKIVGLIWYGYPKLTPAQQRADLDDVLTELP